MSETEFKTKILTALVNEINVSFLLIVKYRVRNIWTNFKQKLLKRSMSKNSFISKNLPSECNVHNVESALNFCHSIGGIKMFFCFFFL